jgi:sporulation protein YlmC with PRC-barrel domain
VTAHRFVRLEDLLGRRVVDAHGTIVGRIGEVRAERRGDVHEVTEYLLGSGALVERLSIVRRLLGRRARVVVVRWDQMDLHHPEAPRLTCAASELKVEAPRG